MQITVVERAQKIQIQEQEIIRRERELDAKVRKPAEAEKFRLEKIAEANKSVVLLLFFCLTIVPIGNSCEEIVLIELAAVLYHLV